MPVICRVVLGVFLLSMATPAAADVRIVPSYSGAATDLIVVRGAWPDSCPPDIRPEHVRKQWRGDTLVLSLVHAPATGGCAFAITGYRAIWSLGDLGVTRFPDQLAVEVRVYDGHTYLEAGLFQRSAARFRLNDTLERGWWKSVVYPGWATLAVEVQGERIGFSLLANEPDGAPTWRAGGGAIGNARGLIDLYLSQFGELLDGSPPLIPNRLLAGGRLEFVIEGPGQLWVRQGSTSEWRSWRPYYFGAALDRVDFDRFPRLSGNWRWQGDENFMINVGAPVQAGFGTPLDYPVSFGRASGALHCDRSGCQFSSDLPAPLGGLSIPFEGITLRLMASRSESGWTARLRRVAD